MAASRNRTPERGRTPPPPDATGSCAWSDHLLTRCRPIGDRRGTDPRASLRACARAVRVESGSDLCCQCRREEDEDQETHDDDHRDGPRQDDGKAAKRPEVCSHGFLTPSGPELLRSRRDFTN